MRRLSLGWAAVSTWAVLVYVFMFLPVAVVVLLSFNAEASGIHVNQVINQLLQRVAVS